MNRLTPLIRLLPDKPRIALKRFYYGKILSVIVGLRNLRLYGQYDFFNTINIETTTYCNLRCKFCPNSIYDRGLMKNKKLMNSTTFKKIIDELSSINYRGGIALQFYGEPLSDDRIPEFLAYTRKKCPKASITLNSNGFLLNIELYKKLVSAGVDNILISQYGETMPPGCKTVLEYVKRTGIPNKITYRMFGEKGSDAIYNRGGDLKLEKIPDLPSCVYSKKVIHVNVNGDALICAQDYHGTISFGNLKNEKLIDIWNKPQWKKIRKELDAGIFKYTLCKKCVGQIK